MIYHVTTYVVGFLDTVEKNKKTGFEINIKAVMIKDMDTKECQNIKVFESEDNKNVGIMASIRNNIEKNVILDIDVRPGKGSEWYHTIRKCSPVKSV